MMASARPDEKYALDSKITSFIRTVQQSDNVKIWPHFLFLVQTADGLRYIGLRLANLQTKYGLSFLDRIQLVMKDRRLNATVVGEHDNQLYINLDKQYYAVSLQRYSNSNETRIVRNVSGETDFESETEFSKLHLGFYLTTFNSFEQARRKEWEEKSSLFFERKGIHLFFKAKLELNDAYLDNTVALVRYLKSDFQNLPKIVTLLEYRVRLQAAENVQVASPKI